MNTPRFTITQANGKKVTGVIQGNGGMMSRVADVERQVALATEGLPLGIYEPEDGHCDVFEQFSAQDNGPRTRVDLRGAKGVREEMATFGTWEELMVYARSGAPLFYQAPMNIHPARLWKFEARPRTIRIWPPGSEGRGRMRTADPFTADRGHLDRFCRPE